MLKKTFYAMLVTGVAFGASVVAGDFNYIDEKAAARQLIKDRNYKEAMQAFVDLSQQDISDYQQSDALCIAVNCALHLKNYDKARELVEKIPLDDFRAMKDMRVLRQQRNEEKIVEKYKDTDFSEFRAIVRGNCYRYRADAYYRENMYEEAKSDILEALKYLRNNNTVAVLTNSLANIYESHDENIEKAVKTYRSVYDRSSYKGAAAAMRVAGILAEQEKYEKALAELEKIDERVHKNQTYKWRIISTKTSIYEKMGEKDKAVKVYEDILNSEEASSTLKKNARQALIEYGVLEEDAENKDQ